MAIIIPIRDLKNTTKVSELTHSVEEPVFITKNGYGDMVIMSLDVYETLKTRILSQKNEEPEFKNKTESKPFDPGKKYSLEEIKETVVSIVDGTGVRSVILFGSYAKNNANRTSSIDLLLDCDLEGFKYLSVTDKLENAFRVPVRIFNINDIPDEKDLANKLSPGWVRLYGEE